MKRMFLTVPLAAASLFFATAQNVADKTNSLNALRASFVEASIAYYSPSPEVTEHFIAYSDSGRANDVLLLQLYMSVALPDAEVERIVALFDDDHWSDIDYADKTRGRWQPTLHITRMYALAKLYANPASKWYGNTTLQTLLHSAMNYWFDTMPQCPNWWHNDIGVPKKLTAVLLMMRDELSADEIAGGLKVLERSAFGRTGQNKVWLAGNNLMRGLLTDDAALVQRARDNIAEEIYLTTDEGIQPDWSFHQHGAQIQFGNYGLAYAEGLSFWFRVLDGSPYAFSDEHYRILSTLLREGICWSVWSGVMDSNFCGRQVFIDGGRGKAYSLAVAAQNMAATRRADSAEFAHIAAQTLQPELYRNTLCGARYYRRSDCGIYRTADWYASNRMHSERTIGFEMTNRENTLANFSADGAMIVMQDGGEYENIFARWDWRKVPGATTYDDGQPLKSSNLTADKRNYSLWVGGVTGAGTMATAMELNRDGLHALKADFFFDDAVVALGCGIGFDKPDCKALTTSVDQNNLGGDVTVGDGNRSRETFAPNEPIDRIDSSTRWIHHRNRGYVVLDGSMVGLTTATQCGLWDYIDPFYHEKADSGRVLKLWIAHNPAIPNNTYAYAILPCRTVGQTAAFARKPSVEVLRNDPECQAVARRKTVCAVFHKAGTLTAGKTEIEVSAPTFLVFDGKTLSVASPLAETERVVVTLRQGRKIRRAEFTLPTDTARLGETVTKTL